MLGDNTANSIKGGHAFSRKDGEYLMVMRARKGLFMQTRSPHKTCPYSHANQGYTSVCIKSNSDWSKRSALDAKAWNHFPCWVNGMELRVP